MTASSRKNYSGSSISFAYSVNGLITSATDSSSGTAHAFAYDNLNRLITEDTRFTGVSGTLTQSWGYDLASNVTSYATRKNGSTLFANNYTYDGMSRLSVLTQSGSSVNDKSLVFGYNNNSQAESITRYANLAHSGTTGKVIATTLVYDSMNRVTSQSHALGPTGGTTLLYSQSYNIASQIVAFGTADGTSNFTYDNGGQLLTVSAGAMAAENFAFDLSGNRDYGDYATGSDNQMIAAPSLANTSNHYEYAYDHEGNQTDRWLKNGGGVTLEHVTYDWDFKNRLSQTQTYAGTTNTLTQTVDLGYDAFGKRSHQMVTNNTASSVIFDQRFVYNGENITAAVDATTLVPQQVFLHGLNQNEFYAQDNVGTSSTMTLWMSIDHQGTVRDVVSSAGSVLNHVVYNSFGRIDSQTNPAYATLVLYTSQIYDIYTGLFYYNARWYDAANGKFISVDPIGFKSGVTDLYVYCDNDPIQWIDATGTKIRTSFRTSSSNRTHIPQSNSEAWEDEEMLEFTDSLGIEWPKRYEESDDQFWERYNKAFEKDGERSYGKDYYHALTDLSDDLLGTGKVAARTLILPENIKLFVKAAAKMTQANNAEYGGAITFNSDKDGKPILTGGKATYKIWEPIKGTLNQVEPKGSFPSEGYTMIGSYHTHPDNGTQGNTMFSVDDIDYAFANKDLRFTILSNCMASKIWVIVLRDTSIRDRQQLKANYKPHDQKPFKDPITADDWAEWQGENMDQIKDIASRLQFFVYEGSLYGPLTLIQQ